MFRHRMDAPTRTRRARKHPLHAALEDALDKSASVADPFRAGICGDLIGPIERHVRGRIRRRIAAVVLQAAAVLALLAAAVVYTPAYYHLTAVGRIAIIKVLGLYSTSLLNRLIVII